MEKVQIIPPPKEVDPSVLAWKGAAVLGKMDGVSDLWVTKSDWVCAPTIEMRFDAKFFLQGYSGNAWIEGKVFLSVKEIVGVASASALIITLSGWAATIAIFVGKNNNNERTRGGFTVHVTVAYRRSTDCEEQAITRGRAISIMVVVQIMRVCIAVAN